MVLDAKYSIGLLGYMEWNIKKFWVWNNQAFVSSKKNSSTFFLLVFKMYVTYYVDQYFVVPAHNMNDHSTPFGNTDAG